MGICRDPPIIFHPFTSKDFPVASVYCADPACTEAKHYIIFASYSSTSPEELALKDRALSYISRTGTGQKPRQLMSMMHNFRQKS